MSEQKSIDTNKPETTPNDFIWAQLEAILTSRLASVEDEIRRYPAPIPACDAQFNYLLEQRSGIPREIARMRVARESSASAPDQREALDAFISSCPYIDSAALRRVQSG